MMPEEVVRSSGARILHKRDVPVGLEVRGGQAVLPPEPSFQPAPTFLDFIVSLFSYNIVCLSLDTYMIYFRCVLKGH